MSRRTARLVSSWQDHVLGLVRAQNVTTRSIARTVPLDEEPLALALTAGLLGYGAGADTVNDSSAAPDQLLTSLFGAEPLRELALAARADLRERVSALFDEEMLRFEETADAAGVPPTGVRELAEAAGAGRVPVSKAPRTVLRRPTARLRPPGRGLGGAHRAGPALQIGPGQTVPTDRRGPAGRHPAAADPGRPAAAAIRRPRVVALARRHRRRQSALFNRLSGPTSPVGVTRPVAGTRTPACGAWRVGPLLDWLSVTRGANAPGPALERGESDDRAIRSTCPTTTRW
jgi:hypothetical protein